MTSNVVTRSDDVRVLPFRVRPLPDEPFDSWLEAMAATYGATVSEMACALGLIEQQEGVAVSATAWMADNWATELTDEQASRLEASTGIAADQFHEMTRMRFASHAIRYTRQGRISAQCPAAGTAGRYCPECLVDSGGRWRMSWQFPFGFACFRHRRLLVDRCPVCELPARRRAHPLALIPVPGRCHNPVQGPKHGPQANRCRADLASHPMRIPVPRAVLDAQRAMMRIVSNGQAGFGIYTRAPQPAVPVLEDIRLLSRTARDAIVRGERLDISPIGQQIVELFRESEDWTTAVRARPDSAVGAAVGTTLAVTALADPAAVAALLQGRLAQSSSYTAHTPQVQTLIATALGRRRRPTIFLQSAPPSGVSPTERARKLPAQLWSEWISIHAPLRSGNEVAASALAAAVVFTGTRLTHSAALALLDPHAPARQVTHVMRDLGRTAHDVDTLNAILRLTAFLDTHDVPIDYTRRRALEYTRILPERDWRDLCRAAAVSPGTGRRWRLARAFLYQTLSGNPLRVLPAGWDAAGVTPHTVAGFARGLPRAVRPLLENVAADFLAGIGIDEPITWTPPSADTSPAEGGQLTRMSWPPSRPARTAVTQARSADQLAKAYVAGASIKQIAADSKVSRQTVSRILAEAGTPIRRGRPRTVTVDTLWLLDQYEQQDQTMAQIARRAGCSETTINRRLHAAGATIRSRGDTCGESAGALPGQVASLASPAQSS